MLSCKTDGLPNSTVTVMPWQQVASESDVAAASSCSGETRECEIDVLDLYKLR